MRPARAPEPKVVAVLRTTVASRGELLAELFTSHYLPSRLRGNPPGRYGYFLRDA